MASFFAVLTNVSGSLKKKDQLKPGDLYEPQLGESSKAKPAQDESPREKAKRVAAQQKAVRDEIERIAALAPPIDPQ